MEGPKSSLPPLPADMVLVHAPAFFDFRERRDIYFPFLGTCGDVPITPLYEYFPVGFKTLQRFLGDRGLDVRIINLSERAAAFSRTRPRQCDPCARYAGRRHRPALDGPRAGQPRGRQAHSRSAPGHTGSFSAGSRRPTTRYELIRYPFIDMVMRGYDTHEPMLQLLSGGNAGRPSERIANLVWKDDAGAVRDNRFSYKPDDLRVRNRLVAAASRGNGHVVNADPGGTVHAECWLRLQLRLVRRLARGVPARLQAPRAMARKPIEEIGYEFETIRRIPNVGNYHFYSVGSYNESPLGMRRFLDQVEHRTSRRSATSSSS